MVLSLNDVAGLHHLLATGHQKICLLLNCAISGLYHPQGGFLKCDPDIAFLVKAIGGPCLLYALGKSHGLASWRVTLSRDPISG